MKLKFKSIKVTTSASTNVNTIVETVPAASTTKGRKRSANTSPRLKTNTKRDVGDPTYDLIKVFSQRSISDMDDKELEERITNLQKMRLIRVTTAKKKTALDSILASITVESARSYIATLEKREFDLKTEVTNNVSNK